MPQTITPCNPSPEDIEKINIYARKKVNPKDIYIFQLILCDNDIDRDFEAFTEKTIIKLSELFKGVTGIFDHNPKSTNQISRIYETCVEKTNEKTMYEENKIRLKAHAYMINNDANKNLIDNINSGIMREVSVCCSVQKKTCSICGAIYDGSCEHTIGKKYDGKYCYIKLENPTDAFEWSFVAIPSQKGAGVVKNFIYRKQNKEMLRQYNIGTYYENKLKSQVVKLGFLNKFMHNNDDAFKDIVNKLSVKELEAFKDEFEEKLKYKNFDPILIKQPPKKQTTESDFII